jgi:hypothetical protein
MPRSFAFDTCFLISKHRLNPLPSVTSWLSHSNSFVFRYLLAFEHYEKQKCLCFQQPLGFVRRKSIPLHFLSRKAVSPKAPTEHCPPEVWDSG